MDKPCKLQNDQRQDVEANGEDAVQMRPLLHTVSLLGDEGQLKRILLNGVDLNELDFAGCTCVQLAAAAGHMGVVQILVDAGASIANRDTSHGNTALHEAAWRGYSRLVKFLSTPQMVNVQNKGGFTALHLSCQAGHNQSTRELLLAEGNPNIANTYGDTALHTSVRYGHAGVARILLSARSMTDIRNKNGDTPLHISAAMGRKKLTKILLSAGCLLNVQNNQNESPLDISRRKGFEEVTSVLVDPPKVVTPVERDAKRASKYKNGSFPTVDPCGPSRSSKRSNTSKSKSTSSINHGGHSLAVVTAEVPKWSPYGCHNQPNSGIFPPPNIDSLPSDPLTTGELYYLDLAGNIHKGPMGVSEGCYCGPPLLSNQAENCSSSVQLESTEVKVRSQKTSSGDNRNRHHDHQSETVRCDVTPKYEDQLQSLTHQLSKIHFDTQAQLNSLQSMLNERLNTKEHHRVATSPDENEAKLKEWVKQYRRFRRELAKNPKSLQQADDLLASASSLLSTRLASPAPPDSETDSGL